MRRENYFLTSPWTTPVALHSYSNDAVLLPNETEAVIRGRMVCLLNSKISDSLFIPQNLELSAIPAGIIVKNEKMPWGGST